MELGGWGRTAERPRRRQHTWMDPTGRKGRNWREELTKYPIPTPNLSKVSQFSKTLSKERKGKTFN